MAGLLTLPWRAAAPKPLRILVADDNEMLRTAVGGLLLSFGHSVDVVSDGREAVEAADRDAYDLIFLDIQMPEMGGLEASRLLRQGGRGGARTRIVGLSGEASDRMSCKAAGMDEFLDKPVRLADLVGVLSHLPRVENHPKDAGPPL